MKSRSRSKTNKKPKKQKGGVGIRLDGNITDSPKAFIWFIRNSTFAIKTLVGASGIIITARLKPDVQSPYYSIRPPTFNTNIQEIIIKLIFVDGPATMVIPAIRPGHFEKTTIDDFKDEVKIQQEIFTKSCLEDNGLEAVCPALVYFDIITQEIGIQYLLCIIASSGGEVRDVMNTIWRVYQSANSPDHPNYNPNLKLGCIAMESAVGYQTLESLKSDSNYGMYATFALFELKRLHKLGFIHGDLHRGNILVNKEGSYFDQGLGQVLIIDFGRTKRYVDSNELPQDEKDLIIQLIQTEMIATNFVATNNAGRDDFVPLTKLRPISQETPNFIWKGYAWMEKIIIMHITEIVPIMQVLQEKRDAMKNLFTEFLSNSYPDVLTEIDVLAEDRRTKRYSLFEEGEGGEGEGGEGEGGEGEDSESSEMSTGGDINTPRKLDEKISKVLDAKSRIHEDSKLYKKISKGLDAKSRRYEDNELAENQIRNKDKKFYETIFNGLDKIQIKRMIQDTITPEQLVIDNLMEEINKIIQKKTNKTSKFRSNRLRRTQSTSKTSKLRTNRSRRTQSASI